MLHFTDSLSRDDVRHTPRNVVFGIAAKGSEIACVAAYHRGVRGYFDLPGGKIDDGETEKQALVREFEEETGLIVEPTKRLTEAGQYYLSSDGDTWRYSFGGLWAVTVVGQGKKKEDHLALAWMDPSTAIATLRHESHGWFVLAWLRWQQRDGRHYGRKLSADYFPASSAAA